MSKNRPTPVAPTRKQLSRAQRDRQLRNYIRIAAAVVAVLVVGILAFGVVDQTVLQPNRPVASVNGVNITTVNFEKHVRYTRMQAIQQYWQMQQYAQYFGPDQFSAQMTQAVTDLSSPTTMGQKTIDQMVSDEIVRQEAKKRNITLNPAEVDQQIQQAFFFYPNGTPTPGPTSTPAPTDTPVPTRVNQPTETPTPVPSITPSDTPTGTPTPGSTPTNTPSPTITPTSTPYTQALFNRDWKDAQARIEAASGLSSADIRAIFENSLYRTKLTAIWEATPETGSVHARHILVSSQVTATQIISQLQAGADFATLAAQYSEDTSTKDSGGDLGFFTKGQMQPEFEAAAFAAPVGLITTSVQTVYGWHVIEVLGTKEETPDQARTRAFTDWVTKEAADPTVVTRYDSWWQAHIPTDPVLNTAVPPTPFPTSQP